MAQGGWRGGFIAIEIGNLSMQKKFGYDVRTPEETLRRGQGVGSPAHAPCVSGYSRHLIAAVFKSHTYCYGFL